MMESELPDDDSIFITQNTFSQADDFPDISTGDVCDMYLDMLEDKEIISFFPQSVSDDEMVNAVTQMEEISAPQVIPEVSTSAKSSRIRKLYSDDEIQKISVRRQYDEKIRWAANLFCTWKQERNDLARFDRSISPIQPDLENMTKDELNFCISRFVCEVRKENGEEYPGQTLYELVIQLQLHLEQNNVKVKLLNDDSFMQVRNTLDYVMKERAKAGVGTEKRKAQIITLDEENQMWEKGILGMDTPEIFLDTLVYLIGMNFAFRAALEHRNLRWKSPQLTLVQAENGEEALRYKEDVSKSNQGGLDSRKIKPKIVYAFQNKTFPERCLIRCYKLYVNHCPDSRPEDAFYLKPLRRNLTSIWFANAPVGVNRLRGAVTRISKAAGLTGLRTNHSLRSTAATRLYEAGFDEQLISEITGHRSESVREYKRTNEMMKRKANSVVSGEADVGKSKLDDDQVLAKVPRVEGNTPTVTVTGKNGQPVHITVNVNVNQ